MIQAYEGKEPYIFVSYAHKDNAIVFRIIEQLSARGYRIWYDEGIEPGAEWPEYIANHLIGAEMVISILTPNAVNSVNCRREINFALSKDKPLLTIYLEKMEIPAGLELQLSTQQSILYYNYDSDERFLDKVETCQHLKPCRRQEFEAETPSGQMGANASSGKMGANATAGQVGANATAGQVGANASAGQVGANATAGHAPSARSGVTPAKIALAAGACVAVLVIFLLVNSGKKTDVEKEPSGTVATAESVTEDTAGNDVGSEVQSGSDSQGGSGSDAQADAGSGTDVQATSGSDSQGGSDTDAQADAGSGTEQNDSTSGQDAGSDAAVGNWNYTIRRTEESTTYSFARGPQIVLPASWGQITVLEEGDMVGFYHTASKEAWEVEGFENTGYLFKLGFDPTQDYKSLPSYMDLGKTSEGYFYLMFPTDFQGYADDERIREQYQAMSSELDYVKLNSYMSE